MSIKKSQEFVYFQAKAKHYDTIRNSKPQVKDQLEKQYRRTLDHESSPPKYSHPPLQRHQIMVENAHIINRIASISSSRRREVQVKGNYSRYFNNERCFRQRNPHREDIQRTIELENEEYLDRLKKTKAVVGSNAAWNEDYRKSLSHKRNSSRYFDNQKSKGSLQISTERFIPQIYRNFITNNDELSHSFEDKVKFLSKQKLTQLPRIRKNQSKSMMGSKESHQTIAI